MKLEVIFTPTADETFDTLGQQIQTRFGEREVSEFRKRVYAVIDIISLSPLIFKSFDDNENLRKASIHKNCSMLYEINDTRIDILFFWDNRQDPFFEA